MTISSNIASVYLLEWHEWQFSYHPFLLISLLSICWNDMSDTVSIYHPFVLISLPSICWNDMSDTVPYTTHFFWYCFRLSVGMTWVTQFPIPPITSDIASVYLLEWHEWHSFHMPPISSDIASVYLLEWHKWHSFHTTHFFWYRFRLSVGMTWVTQFPYTTHFFWYRCRLSAGMTWVTQFPYTTRFFWYCFRHSFGLIWVVQFPYRPLFDYVEYGGKAIAWCLIQEQ